MVGSICDFNGNLRELFFRTWVRVARVENKRNMTTVLVTDTRRKLLKGYFSIHCITNGGKSHRR